MGLKHGSLFSGIGGFDLAADGMGWENVFHCEWNEFGKKILKYYWPKSISYDDIKKTDFNIHRGRIDVLSGGFPCQPYSQAGKRLGKEDERHLWPQMLRAIREIQPTWVVGENVRGLVNWSGGLVFDEVQIDLENQGYKVWAFMVPACAVNAPHRRDRVWFIAYAGSHGHKLGRFRENRREERKSQSQRNKRERVWNDRRRNGESGTLANANRTRLQKTWTEQQATRFVKRGKLVDNVTNTNNERLERFKNKRTFKRSREKTNQQPTTRICPDWENFPTQSPVCSGNDGFSSRLDGITFPKWRNESIKGAGNAIVPQVALQIFKAIQDYKSL